MPPRARSQRSREARCISPRPSGRSLRSPRGRGDGGASAGRAVARAHGGWVGGVRPRRARAPPSPAVWRRCRRQARLREGHAAPPRRGGWAGGAARGALRTGQAWQGVGAFREGCPRPAACARSEPKPTHPPRGSGRRVPNAGGWGAGAGGRHTDGLAGGNARSEARRRQLKGAPPRTQASAKGDGTAQAWAGCGGWVAGCPLGRARRRPRRARGVPPRSGRRTPRSRLPAKRRGEAVGGCGGWGAGS